MAFLGIRVVIVILLCEFEVGLLEKKKESTTSFIVSKDDVYVLPFENECFKNSGK